MELRIISQRTPNPRYLPTRHKKTTINPHQTLYQTSCTKPPGGIFTLRFLAPDDFRSFQTPALRSYLKLRSSTLDTMDPSRGKFPNNRYFWPLAKEPKNEIKSQFLKNPLEIFESKSIGYPGRDHRQGGEDFFSKKKLGADFFFKKKLSFHDLR